MTRVLSLAVLLLAALPGAAPPARADDDHERARLAVQRGEILPLEEILRRLPLAADERLLEVEVERDDGIWIYEIEVVSPSGRVREFEVDARDGRVIEVD
jgi:uncharacterized membrane protein YkoI